jgi:hypothetical protein
MLECGTDIEEIWDTWRDDDECHHDSDTDTIWHRSTPLLCRVELGSVEDASTSIDPSDEDEYPISDEE